jgi:hypothetical protein
MVKRALRNARFDLDKEIRFADDLDRNRMIWEQD